MFNDLLTKVLALLLVKRVTSMWCMGLSPSQLAFKVKELKHIFFFFILGRLPSEK